MASRFPRPALLLLAPTALALGIFAGCGSGPERNPSAEAVAAMKAERPIAMKGVDGFFEGKVDATVTVSRGFGRGNGVKKGRGMERTDQMADISNMEDDEAMSYLRARAAMGSPMPPVTIKLILTNKTKDPVDVEILEVNSDLGNFAVQPSKLTLAADQVGQPDPMFSRLGVTSDEIPVKVTLRVAGKKETKVVAVKSIPVADQPPAPPVKK